MSLTHAEQFAQHAENMQVGKNVIFGQDISEVIAKLQELIGVQEEIGLRAAIQPIKLNDEHSTFVLSFEDGSVVDPQTMKTYEDSYAAKMAALEYIKVDSPNPDGGSLDLGRER